MTKLKKISRENYNKMTWRRHWAPTMCETLRPTQLELRQAPQDGAPDAAERCASGRRTARQTVQYLRDSLPDASECCALAGAIPCAARAVPDPAGAAPGDAKAAPEIQTPQAFPQEL